MYVGVTVSNKRACRVPEKKVTQIINHESKGTCPCVRAMVQNIHTLKTATTLVSVKLCAVITMSMQTHTHIVHVFHNHKKLYPITCPEIMIRIVNAYNICTFVDIFDRITARENLTK